MMKRIDNNVIDWEMLSRLPLDTKLAKKAAPRISDHTAENQIATALHESIHIIYAIKHDAEVVWMEIATAARPKKPNDRFVKGSINDDLGRGSIGVIESYSAAALFELLLDDDEDNYAATIEEKYAIESIKQHRYYNKDNISLKFVSDNSFINSIFERIYPSGGLEKHWNTIKTVAKALLYYRTKEGYIIGHTWAICDYVKKCLPQDKVTVEQTTDFYYTIKRLSPFVKKQNALEMKRHEKWMRENDLDTILGIIEAKQKKERLKQEEKELKKSARVRTN